MLWWRGKGNWITHNWNLNGKLATGSLGGQISTLELLQSSLFYVWHISINPWPYIHVPKWAIFSESQKTSCIFPWAYAKKGTPNCILVTFERKQSLVLHLENSPPYHMSFPSPTHISAIDSFHPSPEYHWVAKLTSSKSLLQIDTHIINPIALPH